MNLPRNGDIGPEREIEVAPVREPAVVPEPSQPVPVPVPA